MKSKPLEPPKFAICQGRVYVGFNVRVGCNKPMGHAGACESWSVSG